HERLEPGLVGFRSHEQMWDLRADRLKLPPNAHRFEFSTMAYGCAPGLASSIDYLLRLDVGRIFSRNKTLADLLIEGLRERNAEILSPPDAGALLDRRHPVRRHGRADLGRTSQQSRDRRLGAPGRPEALPASL